MENKILKDMEREGKILLWIFIGLVIVLIFKLGMIYFNCNTVDDKLDVQEALDTGGLILDK